MTPPGSRTRTTDVWLLPEDETLLGKRISEVLPQAAWRCSQPGPLGLHQLHLHVTVGEAMSCGGTQAFLPLPAGGSVPASIALAPGVPPPAGPPAEAILQLLRSAVRTDDQGEHFASGRLAVSWFEPEVGPDVHETLTAQTRLIWSALRATTRPAVIEDSGGRHSGGMRIGSLARQLVIEQGMPLIRSGWQRFRLSGANA